MERPFLNRFHTNKTILAIFLTRTVEHTLLSFLRTSLSSPFQAREVTFRRTEISPIQTRFPIKHPRRQIEEYIQSLCQFSKIWAQDRAILSHLQAFWTQFSTPLPWQSILVKKILSTDLRPVFQQHIKLVSLDSTLIMTLFRRRVASIRSMCKA